VNIDERLERLAERHEALTQTVEHIALQGEEQNKRLDKVLAALDKDAENIRSLARIAEIHEHRISQLESGDNSV
jgi:predicted transcriptional regulator